jgi:hypothetical protein
VKFEGFEKLVLKDDRVQVLPSDRFITQSLRPNSFSLQTPGLKASVVSESAHRYRILHHVKDAKTLASTEKAKKAAASILTAALVFDTQHASTPPIPILSDTVGMDLVIKVNAGSDTFARNEQLAARCIKRIFHRGFWTFENNQSIFAPSYPKVYIRRLTLFRSMRWWLTTMMEALDETI